MTLRDETAGGVNRTRDPRSDSRSMTLVLIESVTQSSAGLERLGCAE